MDTISSGAKSLEQMVEEFEVDTDFREASKLKTNTRQQGQKVKNADGSERTALIDLRQTLVERLPKYKEQAERSTETLAELLSDKGIAQPAWKVPSFKESDKLGGLMLTDLHLTAMDVNNSSLTKRMKMANDKIQRVMERILKFDPCKLLIPNMGDMNESDMKHKTSSLKVETQNNVSQKDGYKRLLEREVKMLENMKQYGLPMKYVKMGGNHDNNNSYISGIALQYYFGDSIDIEVVKNRYYEIWGSTLIALSHGDRGEGHKLFQMIVDECLTKTRKKLDHLYAYLGHHHRTITQQVGPVEIKNLQAPLPRIPRAEKHGTDMKQSMSGFIRSKDEGQILEMRG